MKISAAQLLFGNVLHLDRGILLPHAERLDAESKPMSRHMSDMLKMQVSLLKASAKELLRTDMLHVSAKQLHTEYFIGSYVLVHYRSATFTFAHFMARSDESCCWKQFQIYSSRPNKEYR